jgi:galacturan 1,4-alpha-galacturonidase
VLLELPVSAITRSLPKSISEVASAKSTRAMHYILSQAILVALATLTSASPFGPAPIGPFNNGKTCTVIAHGHQRDDTPQILSAFERCNHGGTVVFPEGQNYWIGTKLNPVIYDVTVDWKGVWTVRPATCRI